MSKEALIERANALQAELEKLQQEINKPAVPEGFTEWNPTEKSVCPCHPKDIVKIITKGGSFVFGFEAEKYPWSALGQSSIIAYKITKKYTPPRPMKFSEIPVGALFTWRYKHAGKTNNSKDIFVKFSEDTSKMNSVLVGDSVRYHFTDNENTRFFSVEASFNVGGLMIAPTE